MALIAVMVWSQACEKGKRYSNHSTRPVSCANGINQEYPTITSTSAQAGNQFKYGQCMQVHFFLRFDLVKDSE